MAMVSKQFKANFDEWIKKQVKEGSYTESDVVELKEIIKADLSPGPDMLRGIKVKIDDHKERYKLWDDFFREELGYDSLATN